MIYFTPQLVVNLIGIIAKIRKGFAPCKRFLIREGDFTVSDIVILNQFTRRIIRRRVGNILKVFQCDVRPAEEIQEFLCVLDMLRIFWNAPGIDPDVGAFFWNNVFQIRVFTLRVDSFTGVNNADSRLISDHLVTHLIHNVRLHERFLCHKQILRLRQLLDIGGV